VSSHRAAYGRLLIAVTGAIRAPESVIPGGWRDDADVERVRLDRLPR